MSLAELLIILLVAMVVFGPEKLPSVARHLGKWAAKGQQLKNKVLAQIDKEKLHLQLEDNIKKAETAERSDTPDKKT